MVYTVEFTPEAMEQLAVLYRYIATKASPEIAKRYTDAIVTHCEDLQTFPHRGNQRDDIRPGLRITNYRKRAVIAFAVDDKHVFILGVFYGGQDFEVALQFELGDQPFRTLSRGCSFKNRQNFLTIKRLAGVLQLLDGVSRSRMSLMRACP